ncbi:uncharacterized protein [Musca autumnalis]|uniref:uncharacterized protein n=1 Tax=Musca autumnalis TaxID=221902 RepID=UPI003CEF170D
MASNNIQKIVQNNFHLNPWVLSKNTNEIVNTYIQKIYKQMPFSYRKDLKPPKIAAERPENKAPIRTFKSQQLAEQQASRIVPQTTTGLAKKSARSKPPKLNHERLIQILGTCNQNNQQIRKKSTSTISSVLAQKKAIKSPNLKIYGSRRYGSSASSSRSSLFRRHDDKRQRQRQASHQPQLNIISRSMHSSGGGYLLHDSIAKCLMPLRNQHVKANLGSLPEAMRVSSSIQNDLMAIDAVLRKRISVNGGKKEQIEVPEMKHPLLNDRLKAWNHPPPLDKFPINNLNDLLVKTNQKQLKSHPEKPNHNRMGMSPLNQSSSIDVDFKNSELKEWHRRNRMKKLGLAKDSPKPTMICNPTDMEKAKIKCCDNQTTLTKSKINEMDKCVPSDVGRHFRENNKSAMKNAGEPNCKVATSKHGNIFSSATIKPPPSSHDLIVTPSSSESSTLPQRFDGPLALATANLSAMMAHKRFDRGNFMAITKY